MKRPREKKPCPTKKATWGTVVRATYAAGKLGRIHGHKLFPYECPTCGEWHLSTDPASLDNRKRTA